LKKNNNVGKIVGNGISLPKSDDYRDNTVQADQSVKKGITPKMPRDFRMQLEFAGTVCEIVSHVGMHADELLPIFALDVMSAKDPERVNAFFEKYAEPGNILYLGVGRGKWDEHFDPQNPDRKVNGETATSLFTKDLGIAHDSEWAKILRFINLNDSDGSQNPRDIATLLTHMNLQNPYADERNSNWFLDGLRVKFFFDSDHGDFTIDRIMKTMDAFDGQWQEYASGFFKTAQEWYRQGESAYWSHKIMFDFAYLELIRLRKNEQVWSKRIKINDNDYSVSTILDLKKGEDPTFHYCKNYRMGAALRFHPEVGSDITIVKSEAGHLIINFNKRVPRKLVENCLSTIRMFEWNKKKKEGKLKNYKRPGFKQIKSAGTVQHLEEWFYHDGLRMLFNGTITHPEVPKTGLDMFDIFGAIEIALKNEFHSAERDCIIRCNGTDCQYFSFALECCRTARYLAYERKSKRA
jgi:hypothetical protein